jgi:hypothetical protein
MCEVTIKVTKLFIHRKYEWDFDSYVKIEK